MGGDSNTDFNKHSNVTTYIQRFFVNHHLYRCDADFPGKAKPTYVNESQGHSSVIDYFVCDCVNSILDYCVLDPDINLSDHVPIAIRCRCVYDADSLAADATDRPKVKTLCWDYADMLGYYATTMRLLYPLHDGLIAFESSLYALSSSV